MIKCPLRWPNLQGNVIKCPIGSCFSGENVRKCHKHCPTCCLFQHDCIPTFYALVFLLQQLVPFLFFSPLPSDSLGPPLVTAAGSVSEVRQALVQKPTPKAEPPFSKSGGVKCPPSKETVQHVLCFLRRGVLVDDTR